MEVVQKIDSHLPILEENASEISRTSKTVTSAAMKKCSETEKLEDNQNEKNYLKNRNFFYCKATTSREIKVEIEMEAEQSLFDILSNIKSYLDVCDCSLVRNTQILSYHQDATNEGTHVGSPYYLTLFHKIMKRVFCNGGQYGEVQFWGEHLHLLEKFIALSGQYGEVQFWGEHLHLLEKFIALSDESKQLLIRLFLRKRKWLIADKLSYTSISSSLNPLFNELLEAELVDSSHSSLLEIEEAVHLLHVSSLKSVAKHFKLDFNKGKIEICRSLLKFATQKNVFGITMEKRVLHKIKEELGPCFRIRKEIVNIFCAIFTIYSPMDMNSALLFDQPSINLPSQLLFVLLQLDTDKLRFPAPYNPCLINIYTDAEKLFRYIKAKGLETKVADLTQRGRWTEIIECAKKARIEFQDAYAVRRQFYESLVGDLRRFTDLHVYARCISHGVEALERIRDYAEAVAWLEYMLHAIEFKLILANARGGWWDRLALNLDAHLKDKDRAMKAVIAGLEDPVLGDKDRLSLQDRGRKLCSGWKGPLEEMDPEKISIKGSVLGKNLGEARINRFLIEKNGISCECSVEEVALDHYLRKESFKEGVHAEGALWHTIFGLLFYDVIFDPAVENVWFSETQMNPADLNSRTFYTSRQDLFELRFKEIEEADFDDLLLEMERTYNNYYGVTNSEITWNCFIDFEQVKRFMICCPIAAVCAIFRRLITDYRNCRSGFPDLTVWNDEKKLLAVVEVKGPGDKLSTKQRLWLNFFQNQNITAHVCHVSGKDHLSFCTLKFLNFGGFIVPEIQGSSIDSFVLDHSAHQIKMHIKQVAVGQQVRSYSSTSRDLFAHHSRIVSLLFS
ncbi:coiled-coil domain-containing protein MTMR15 [Loa loa]|uniref:Fanconi-associated nuclease n=1 Tax=Loa loa TaxID=7209 RepID=A0A1S0UI94_LOALO|nr:coiled-coil domain-containing protein MTMR15 [Loa loa]EJD75146.1 coiled-coil domain-containing protein MTMR15 [Loa loa]